METVTYFVTDLPQFSSLAPCAASGLSYAIQGVSSTNPLETEGGIRGIQPLTGSFSKPKTCALVAHRPWLRACVSRMA